MTKKIVVTSRSFKRMPSGFTDSIGFTKFVGSNYEVGISDKLNQEDTARVCIHEGAHILITILQEKGLLPPLKGRREEKYCNTAEEIIYRLLDKHLLST
jgi:hypothetical protein